MLPGRAAMAWLVMAIHWPCEHFGWNGASYVLKEGGHNEKIKTVGSPGQSNSIFTSLEQVDGFEAQGWQFEAGIEEDTDGSKQGFEALDVEQDGQGSACLNLTLEHEHEVNYDLDSCALWFGATALSNVGRLSIEALCIGGLSVISALSNVDGVLNGIAGWLNSVGMLNSWDEAEDKTVDLVANRYTGRLMNQSMSEELDRGHRRKGSNMAVYMLDEERMCLTFEDKCKTDWEGSTQEFGALQLMNKTVQALFQQVDKLLQQVPDAGTVQELAEDFLQRLWQEMTVTRSWIAWTISLIAAWLMSHLGRGSQEHCCLQVGCIVAWQWIRRCS